MTSFSNALLVADIHQGECMKVPGNSHTLTKLHNLCNFNSTGF